MNRAADTHTPVERDIRRIDENFVRVGLHFIRYDPYDSSREFADPKYKRPEKNRKARRADNSRMKIVNGVSRKRGRTKPLLANRPEQVKRARKRQRAERRARALGAGA